MNIAPEKAAELLKRGLAWKNQGARSKWTTKESLALWDLLDELEKEVEANTFSRPDGCPCGEDLPWHMAPFAATKPEHTCACGRHYNWDKKDLTLQLVGMQPKEKTDASTGDNRGPENRQDQVPGLPPVSDDAPGGEEATTPGSERGSGT